MIPLMSTSLSASVKKTTNILLFGPVDSVWSVITRTYCCKGISMAYHEGRNEGGEEEGRREEKKRGVKRWI